MTFVLAVACSHSYAYSLYYHIGIAFFVSMLYFTLTGFFIVF